MIRDLNRMQPYIDNRRIKDMALRRERMRLGDLLIKQNVLTEEQLQKALAKQKGSGKKIGEILVEEGFITEEMIARALQMQLGLKIVHLTGVTIPKEVRGLVKADILKKYVVIPFELDPYNANILHLAMADPMDMAAMDDISIVTNLQVEPYICTSGEILAAIDRCYGAADTLNAASVSTCGKKKSFALRKVLYALLIAVPSVQSLNSAPFAPSTGKYRFLEAATAAKNSSSLLREIFFNTCSPPLYKQCSVHSLPL